MRKLLLIIALACCSHFAFAAGGTCPAGANYLGPGGTYPATNTLASLNITNCYFAGPAGSDAANGTSESTPLLHLPGMSGCANTCAAISPTAATGFIVEGGYVLNYGTATSPSESGAWTWQWSGTSSNPIYLGVDPTWFSGGSFARPILTGNNGTSTSFVTSCTHDNSSLAAFFRINSGNSYLIFDGFEITGACWQSGGGPLGIYSASSTNQHNTFSRNYFHGWSTVGTVTSTSLVESGTTVTATFAANIFPNGATCQARNAVPSGFNTGTGSNASFTISGSTGTSFTYTASTSGLGTASTQGIFTCTQDNIYAYFGSGAAIASNNVWAFNVVDGSDSSAAGISSPNCNFPAYTTSSPCYTGGGIYQEMYDIHGSVFNHLSDAAVTTNTATYHDNYVNNLVVTFQGAGGQHTNCMNEVTNVSGASVSLYNNRVTNVAASECFYLAPGNGGSVYIFNNDFWGNMNFVIGTAPTNCILLNQADSGGTATAYIANNTVSQLGGSGGGCEIQFAPVNSPLFKWTGTANFQNNHLIGLAALTGFYSINGGAGTTTINDLGGEVYQTETAANAQGYTTTNNYAPTTATGASVGTGNNVATSCPTYSADSALCKGTSSAVIEQSGWGGQVATYPAITINARPANGAGNWNTGAFQLTGVLTYTPSSLTFVPQALSTTSAGQTITITNTGASTITLSSEVLQTGTQYNVSSNTCGASLTTLATCVVTITFTPLVNGTLTDNLVVTSSDGTSPTSIPITGIGLSTPVISPVTGSYSGAQTVTITDATSGASIFYTLNGTTPTSGSTLYAGSFLVSTTTTVKAIAILSGSSSGVNTSVITITGTNNNLTTTLSHVKISGRVVID